MARGSPEDVFIGCHYLDDVTIAKSLKPDTVMHTYNPNILRGRGRKGRKFKILRYIVSLSLGHTRLSHKTKQEPEACRWPSLVVCLA